MENFYVYRVVFPDDNTGAFEWRYGLERGQDLWIKSIVIQILKRAVKRGKTLMPVSIIFVHLVMSIVLWGRHHRYSTNLYLMSNKKSSGMSSRKCAQSFEDI